MKKFKTFTVKIEEGLFGRMEKCAKHYAPTRNRYMTDMITGQIECDEGAIRSDEEEQKVTPKQVTPREVTPKIVPTKVTPKREVIADLQALVDKKQVTPKENLGYTHKEALEVVKGWYRRNPDSSIKSLVIENQADELERDPGLIRYYR